MSAVNMIEQGVYVVAASDGARSNAMAASWVTQVSFSPLMVMVAVAKTRYTHGIIEASRAFSISIPKEWKEASEFGSSSGRDSDKMAGHAWGSAKTGSPILIGARGWIDCELVHAYDAGDHTLFVGRVVAQGS